LAADVETACRVTGRDPRPRRCAKAKILDRVFRRDAFSIFISPNERLFPALPTGQFLRPRTGAHRAYSASPASRSADTLFTPTRTRFLVSPEQAPQGPPPHELLRFFQGRTSPVHCLSDSFCFRCPLSFLRPCRLTPQGQPGETSRLHLNVKTAVHNRAFHLSSQLAGNIHRLVGRMHRNRQAGPENAKRRARLGNRFSQLRRNWSTWSGDQVPPRRTTSRGGLISWCTGSFQHVLAQPPFNPAAWSGTQPLNLDFRIIHNAAAPHQPRSSLATGSPSVFLGEVYLPTTFLP